MCGIAGVMRFDGSMLSVEPLERMSQAMQYRGPDDHGIYVDRGVGLVHRRLSIIDLSAAGRCPMSNLDGSIQVVLNGEIYNYQNLRRELSDLGYQFKSTSDTEVLVHGYQHWGADMVYHLDGMFAFAVWDTKKKCMFIARDRVGEKPLYYAKDSASLVFASSLIALREYFGGDMEINPAAIDCYLSHSFIPAPLTIWQSIKPFPPAHRGFCNGNGDLLIQRYWDFPDRPPIQLSVAEAETFIEAELEKSVQAKLVADVRIGGFLSGGVDSSLVMALAAKHNSKIDTFSIGFKEAEFTELGYAREVAQTIDSNHHELIVDENDLLNMLPKLIWQLGQPFADPSILPTYMVSQFARLSVTVSLSGDGGDESFAGYWHYAAAWYAEKYAALVPHYLRKNIVPGLLKRLGDPAGAGVVGRATAMNALSLSASGAAYTNSQSWFNYRQDIFGPKYAAQFAAHDPVPYRKGRYWTGANTSSLRQRTYDDFQVLLPDDYLNKVDIASMAASLEVRAPLLDHRFIEAAWSLPDNMKLRNGQMKWLLKRIAAKHVPRSVIYRPKMGFAMPMKYWWRGRLADALRVLMRDSRIVAYGWVNAQPVMRALDEHLSGRADHDVRLWSILCFELWARIVLEGSLSRNISLQDLLK